MTKRGTKSIPATAPKTVLVTLAGDNVLTHIENVTTLEVIGMLEIAKAGMIARNSKLEGK